MPGKSLVRFVRKMKMIGAELKAKSNEVERILRKEKFKQLQVQFLRWLELENKIKTTIEDAKTQSSVMDELVGMQQNITVEVENAGEPMSSCSRWILNSRKFRKTPKK